MRSRPFRPSNRIVLLILVKMCKVFSFFMKRICINLVKFEPNYNSKSTNSIFVSHFLNTNSINISILILFHCSIISLIFLCYFFIVSYIFFCLQWSYFKSDHIITTVIFRGFIFKIVILFQRCYFFIKYIFYPTS